MIDYLVLPQIFADVTTRGPLTVNSSKFRDRLIRSLPQNSPKTDFYYRAYWNAANMFVWFLLLLSWAFELSFNIFLLKKKYGYNEVWSQRYHTSIYNIIGCNFSINNIDRAASDVSEDICNKITMLNELLQCRDGHLRLCKCKCKM